MPSLKDWWNGTPKPEDKKPEPKTGLLSTTLYIKEDIAKLFNNGALISALKTGKIDLQKEFGTDTKAILNLNSDQKFEIHLKNDTITINFNDTCPTIFVDGFLEITVPLDAILINREQIVLSLVGSPDYTIKLENKRK